MSNNQFTSAVVHRVPLSVLAMTVALVALFYTFATQATPCANAATCNVGDTETFTNATTFEGEINVGATPGPGTAGQVLASAGASTSPDWAFISTTLSKAADETVTTTTTLQDDDDLSFAVEANKRYAVWGGILVNTGTTPDIKVQLTSPASATFDGTILNDISSTSNATIELLVESGTTALTGAGADRWHSFSGTLVVAGTAGSATLQWAQNTSDGGNTTVKAGSWLAYTELN